MDVLASSTVKVKLCAIECVPGRIIVACPIKVYVLDSGTLTLLFVDECYENPDGRFAVSLHPNTLTLIYPKSKQGCVKLANLKEWREGPLHSCHTSSVKYMGITDTAARYCTCSVKFTVVRVFSSETGEKLQQLWITGGRFQPVRLRFSPEGDWLSLLTSSGLVKIYSSILTEMEKISTYKTLQAENPRSVFSFLSVFRESLGEDQAFADYDLQTGLLQADIVFTLTNSWTIVYPKAEGSPTLKIIKLDFDSIHGGKCFRTLMETV